MLQVNVDGSTTLTATTPLTQPPAAPPPPPPLSASASSFTSSVLRGTKSETNKSAEVDD